MTSLKISLGKVELFGSKGYPAGWRKEERWPGVEYVGVTLKHFAAASPQRRKHRRFRFDLCVADGIWKWWLLSRGRLDIQS